MKKYFILSLFLLLSLVVMSAAFAAKASPMAKQVVLPAKATKVAPNVFYLGRAVDKHGKEVEGYAIVKYKDNFGKPGTQCGNGACEPGENPQKCPADCGEGGEDTSSCYAFLAKSAKWKSIEPYLINPINRDLTPEFIMANFAGDVDKWESAAEVDILGAGLETTDNLVADTIAPDNKNEVYFADVAESNAIAITIVWGIFSGPPQQRELVEWDQVYDEVDYDWSASGEAGKIDFENIVTHELGHSVGLGDLYESKCAEATMYGYADYGETKKRTLETGDITGIKKLY